MRKTKCNGRLPEVLAVSFLKMVIFRRNSFIVYCVLLSLNNGQADQSHCRNLSKTLESELDSNSKILSRQKRNFGGSEAIDFDKAITGIFGPTGLLVQGCEVFLDIVWHVSGYTILGKGKEE
jgi:hypothetical protein